MRRILRSEFERIISRRSWNFGRGFRGRGGSPLFGTLKKTFVHSDTYKKGGPWSARSVREIVLRLLHLRLH